MDQQHTPGTLTGRPLTPLDITELAEHIFLFLDDTTINNLVILVCRRWYFINLYRIIREATWDSIEPLKEEETRRLQEVSQINCYLQEGNQSTDKWSELSEVFRTRHQQYLAKLERRKQGELAQQDDGNTTISGGQSLRDLPLQDVRFHGFVDHSLCQLFPYLSSITSLQVRLICDAVIDMRLLLSNCPHLKSISLQSFMAITLSGPWILNEKTLKKRYPSPLRRLDLRGVRFPQSCLESLISISPYLQHLTINKVVQRNAGGPYAFDVKFAQYVDQHCRHLQSYHYSDQDGRSAGVPSPRVTPSSTGIEHTLRGYDLSVRFMRSLQVQPNVLTNLELLTESPRLHECLCVAPYLLHLKAARSNIPLKYFDVHARIAHGRVNTYTDDVMPGVWACRGLRTLHLACYGEGPDPLVTRLIFGYVSVVCPELRDLDINGAECYRTYLSAAARASPLCMGLEGGLCLLTRLKSLGRLRVGAVDCDLKAPDWQWDWMVVSPDKSIEEVKQRKRRAVIESWGPMLEAEARRDALRLQNLCQLEGVDDPTGHIGDRQLQIELQHLGQLKDVVLFLEGLEEEDAQVWPRLQRVSIYRASRFGQSLEKEVQRLLQTGRDKDKESMHSLSTKDKESVLLLSTLSRHPYALTALSADIHDASLIQEATSLIDIRRVATITTRTHSCRMDGPWIPSDHDRYRSLSLRSLVLRMVAFDQSRLEDLPSITPRLCELRLMDLSSRMRTAGQRHASTNAEYDLKRLVACMRSLGITLNSFHMSTPDALHSSPTQREMTEVCQETKEWTLWAPTISNKVFQELESRPIVITILEVF
ncbi:hypothetical protein BGX33_000473 [Mortierella sp. NVP41]|nr:hypothetical protein BGX33_000473 [Mortierella sp. NVP41]